jgi:hypothetical protein
MGENKHIKELDAFAKKYVKEMKQEKPSLDFTASLMQKIALESVNSEVFKAKALISKKGWFIISLLMIAVIFIPFKTSRKSLFNLPRVDLSFFDKLQISNVFESISVSNTVLYAIFFFGLMIIAQVIFLKKHFEKRFN